MKQKTVDLIKIRQAIGDYISSEGCYCCQGADHDEHREVIAKLLNIPKYSDDSGYDFYKFKTKKK